MSDFILFDDISSVNLLPITYLRPVADIRCGILTLREKWENYLKQTCTVFTKQYLRKKFPFSPSNETIYINASVFPKPDLLEGILHLSQNHGLFSDDGIVIAFAAGDEFSSRQELQGADYMSDELFQGFVHEKYNSSIKKIDRLWDIFTFNGSEIEADFVFLTKDRDSQTIPQTNACKYPQNIFIEEGAVVDFSVLNAAHGKIYIGRDAEIMENCSVRGPFALGDHSVLKMGAKIYGDTTIGPHCKVGGEVSNSVIFGYSNKAHDGFLGNSVIAEWCNLGADTNNSNLKNTYEPVKLWSYTDKSFVSTGLQFCGLIMADHSKTAINTMFNTGTVVGVNANIFGAGFPRNFIPSFSWGAINSSKKFQFEKAIEIARSVMQRRNVILSDIDIDILKTVYEMTE